MKIRLALTPREIRSLLAVTDSDVAQWFSGSWYDCQQARTGALRILKGEMERQTGARARVVTVLYPPRAPRPAEG